MKKYVVGAMAFFILGCFSVFAAENPDSFQVEVIPSSFQVNQPVDVVVKAIKNDQVMKNYDGKFMIELVDNNIKAYEYTAPEGGLWEMDLTDQGQKTYSKGLIVKKPGTFTVLVSDFMTTQITGTTVIMVESDTKADIKPIEVLSPQQNGTESESILNVMAMAPELVNSRIQIYLNNLMVKEGMTESSGILTESIPLKKNGTNVIELKAVSIDNQVIGQSDKITFLYESPSTDYFKSIAMTPNQDLKIWDRVRFEVFTTDEVSSAKLLFSWGNEYPLDKEKDGLFVKEAVLTQTWENSIDVILNAGTVSTPYSEVLTFEVKDNIQIGEVKIKLNETAIGVLDLDWAVIGWESTDYAVKYGTWEESLTAVAFTTGTQLSLSGFSYGKQYFFQVLATTPEHVPEGLPSKVMNFTLPIPGGVWWSGEPLVPTDLSQIEHPAPEIQTCTVQNIQFQTKKIANRYYLVWNEIQNVEKYQVYRSDFADGTNKKFIWETTIPRFEYPFDKDSEEDIYAYYTVEAVCTDGKKVVVANAEKVQVGPLEDMLIIFAATVLLYLMYKLYRYSE